MFGARVLYILYTYCADKCNLFTKISRLYFFYHKIGNIGPCGRSDDNQSTFLLELGKLWEENAADKAQYQHCSRAFLGNDTSCILHGQ